MYEKINTLEHLKTMLNAIKQRGECSVDTEFIPNLNFTPKLLGISFSMSPGDSRFLASSDLESYRNNDVKYSVKLELDKFFYDDKIKKIFHNAKADLQCLWSNGFKDINNVYFDTQVAAWVLNPLKKKYGLKFLVKEIFNVDMLDLTEWFKEGKTFKDYYVANPEKAIAYACADADFTWRLYEQFNKPIEDRFKQVFYEIEMPTIPILARMEMHGIKVDRERLLYLKNSFEGTIRELEDKLTAIGTPIVRGESCSRRNPIST